jgi:hypothetical protein
MSKSSRPRWAGERKPFESTRVTARWDGYAKPYWRAFSKAYKVRYPMCCVDGCRQPTYYADHVVPVLQWIEQGGNPLDPDNIQPLCYKHGNEKTGREGKARQMYKADGGSSTPPGGIKK